MQTDPESYSIFAPTLVHLKTTVKKLEVSYEIKPGGESFTLSFKKENRKRTHDNEESQTTYKCLLHSSTDDYCSILTALNNTSEEDQEMLIQGDSEFSSWILKSKKDLLKEPKNALAQLLLRNIEFENRLKTMETELGLIQDTIKNIERFQGKVVEQMDKKAENESQVETNRHIASWVKHAIFTLLDRNRVTFFTKEALMFYLTGHEDPVAAEHVARISGAFRRSTMPHTVSLADKQKVVLFKFLVFEIAKNRVEADLLTELNKQLSISQSYAAKYEEAFEEQLRYEQKRAESAFECGTKLKELEEDECDRVIHIAFEETFGKFPTNDIMHKHISAVIREEREKEAR